jgi:excisionase family DNA binding protein
MWPHRGWWFSRPVPRSAPALEIPEGGFGLTDDQQDARNHLLSLLFGESVPAALEGTMLRTADVALLFEVSERTVSEWAKRGQIPSVRTPGGHRRYPAEGIRWMLDEARRTNTSPGRPSSNISQLYSRHPA